jgi:UDP-N-acetyl-D-mannosaminuronate dehydrogenase
MSMIEELPGTEAVDEQLAFRIKMRIARVAVIGLGYVGLPLAETFAWGGYPVVGFYIDSEKINKL